MTYTFRRALPSEVGRVTELLHARVEWLQGRGLDQWSGLDPARDTAESVTSGMTWLLLTADGAAVGTMTMTTVGHSGFWAPDELTDPALYLSKMATDPTMAGHGLGELLLDSAKLYGSSRGFSRLRWDAWKTNPGLQRYYSEIGGRHLRTVDLSGGWQSGALFESAYQIPKRPEAITIDAPLELFAVIESERHEILTGDVRPAEIQPGLNSLPEHYHLCPDLKYPNLGSTDGGPVSPACIVAPWSAADQHRGDSEGQGTPLTLFNPGTGWRARGMWTHPATGAALNDLSIGHPYHVRHVANTPMGCGVGIFGDALSVTPATQRIV